MKCLRYILAFGCMAAWLWLALYGYADTEFWVYDNAFGHLLAILPFAALALGLMAFMGENVKAGRHLARLWTPASLCMMLPVLLGVDAPFIDHQLLRYVVSMLAGVGFAVGFVVVGGRIATLPVRHIVMVAGGGMLFANILLAGMVLIPQNSLMLMYFVLSATIKLIIPTAVSAPSLVKSTLSLKALIVCSCIYVATGFSRSVYHSLFNVTSTWLPDALADILLIPGSGCLLSLFCIQLSLRSTRGKSLLLLIPVLMVGYTAWPLLHRESLGLSMLTLSFAYTVLDVFSYLALFYSASRTEGAQRQRVLCWGGSALMLGLWLGSFTLPYIRDSLSQGTTVNYLFVFLAVTLLGNSVAFTLILEYMGFWGRSRSKKMNVSHAEEAIPVFASEYLLTEECDSLLRQMGLTRQQAHIATLIAQKSSDLEICEQLNISQSTLKTHVRNILKRLGLNSRYEIAWFIVHNMRDTDDVEPGSTV